MTDSDQAGNNHVLPPTPPPAPPRSGAADGAPQPVPTNETEALEIGRRHFPRLGSPGGPVGLSVHEFDIGYLIRAGWPRRENPTARPSQPGGSNVVIAKDDGEVTFLPNYPPKEAVALYHRLRSRRAS